VGLKFAHKQVYIAPSYSLVEEAMSIESSSDPDGFVELEHSGWEAASQGYERHFAGLTRQSVNALLDAAGVTSGKHLLDLCCGPGMIAAAATVLGARATGVDFSAAVVRIAASMVAAADFHEGDAQSLAFPDEHFDAVVCGFGIIHLSDPQRALTEMHRVLKPGGRVALSVWEPPNPSIGFGLIYGAIRAHANMDVGLPHGPDFFQFSDSAKLSEALLETGFSNPSVDRVPQTWEFGEAHGLVTGIMEGAVRARALMTAQTTNVQQSIENAIDAGMELYASADGLYRVPMPALIGSAQK
jgi:ubiquinone/menaquinone biosynthesis C-methylase UbiE